MQKLKLFILPIITALLVTVVSPAGVLASSKEDVCKGVNFTTGSSSTNCDNPTGARSVEEIVATVINILSVIVGIVAVIMIIVGGLKYITSSGDSNNVQSAKNTILYAVIGLVIVVVAQVLVRFVINTATP